MGKQTIENLQTNIFTKVNGPDVDENHILFDTLLNSKSYKTNELPPLVDKVLKMKRIDYFKEIQLVMLDKQTNYPNDPKIEFLLDIMSKCFNPSELRPSFNDLKKEFKALK